MWTSFRYETFEWKIGRRIEGEKASQDFKAFVWSNKSIRLKLVGTRIKRLWATGNRGLFFWIIILFYNLLLTILRLLVFGGSLDPE